MNNRFRAGIQFLFHNEMQRQSVLQYCQKAAFDPMQDIGSFSPAVQQPPAPEAPPVVAEATAEAPPLVEAAPAAEAPAAEVPAATEEEKKVA